MTDFSSFYHGAGELKRKGTESIIKKTGPETAPRNDRKEKRKGGTLMPIAAAYMVPHPPMIIPRVGRGSEEQVRKTIDAYEAVAEKYRNAV